MNGFFSPMSIIIEHCNGSSSKPNLIWLLKRGSAADLAEMRSEKGLANYDETKVKKCGFLGDGVSHDYHTTFRSQ